MFRDRTHGGEVLAQEILDFFGDDVGAETLIVLGIPRGGIVTAWAVAKALEAPLEPMVSVKMRAPWNPELAIGAVAEGIDPVLEPEVERSGLLSSEGFSQARRRAEADLADRLETYGKPETSLKGRTAILVDDGAATGMTVVAAARSLIRQGVRQLVIGVPVASSDAATILEAECDQLIIPEIPSPFMAVGLHYDAFEPTREEDVRSILNWSRSRRPGQS